jgi:hypothetical protein
MPEIQLPTQGVADQTELRKTPPGTCPPGTQTNMLARKAQTGRKQITKRPALRKAFEQRFGNGPVQGLGTIARASAVTSLAIGDSSPISPVNGVVRRSVRVDANAWLIPLHGTDSRGLRDCVKVYGSAGAAKVQTGGAAAAITIAGVSNFTTSPTPWAVVFNPAGTIMAVLVNYTDTTAKTLIVFVDPATGAFICAKNLAGADVAASAVCWTDRALWIAKGATLHYVVTAGGVESPASLTVRQASGSVSGAMTAAASIVGMATYADTTGQAFIYAAFSGTTGTGFVNNPAGTITAGGYAKSVRSGVYRLREVSQADGSMDFGIEDFGRTPSTADPYVETSGGVPVLHRSVRFSQVLARQPRGAVPTAIACNAAGDWAVSFSNQGYGPTSAYKPDGSKAYTSVAKFTATGELVWEADANTNIGGEAGGKLAGVVDTFPTDLPNEDGGNAGTTSKNGPAVRKLAMDLSGNVYTAERINNGPAVARSFAAGSGNLRWAVNLCDSAQVAGAAGYSATGVAFADGSVFVTATRSNAWTTPTPPYAVLWRLSPIDGSLEWSYDLTQQAPGVAPDNSPSPVCMSASGSVLGFGSAIFTDA